MKDHSCPCPSSTVFPAATPSDFLDMRPGGFADRIADDSRLAISQRAATLQPAHLAPVFLC